MSTLGDFTPQADAYRAARPHYPDDLIDRLMRAASVTTGDTVVDLGAGTGIFTTQLAARSLRVTAVEPNAAMRAQWRGNFSPPVTWIDGTFEQLPLPDASHDWAVAAQAFHWADPPRALPQIARVLRPGRCFTVLWNNRLNDESPRLAEVWRLIRHAVPRFDDNYRDNDAWGDSLAATGHFGPATYDEQRHVVVMDRARFVSLWRSHNRMAALASPGVIDKLIAAIERLVADVDTIEVPYRCRAWTAPRK